MFYELSIATAVDLNVFEDEFKERFAWIKQRGYLLKIINDHFPNSGTNLYRLCLNGNAPSGIFRDKDVLYIFKHQISEMLAEHILIHWEEKMVWHEIVRRYKRCNRKDKNLVLKKSNEILNHYNKNESLNILFNFGRKNKIANRVLEYIDENDLLIVEGFVKFYLPEYLNEIKFVVEVAYEEMRNEQEYNEFVKLLRYFVDTQPAKIYQVNLMMEKEDEFVLWDGSGAKIENNFVSGFFDDNILPDKVNLDDLLISILITVSPRWIILHNTGECNEIESQSVLMIREVFKDRIKFCSGCEHCYHKRKSTDCRQQ